MIHAIAENFRRNATSSQGEASFWNLIRFAAIAGKKLPLVRCHGRSVMHQRGKPLQIARGKKSCKYQAIRRSPQNSVITAPRARNGPKGMGVLRLVM